VNILAKEAAVENGPVVYDKMPREGEGKWTSYVAMAVNKYGEGSSDQSFFSISEE